jgi:hypothetical protein
MVGQYFLLKKAETYLLLGPSYVETLATPLTKTFREFSSISGIYSLFPYNYF